MFRGRAFRDKGAAFFTLTRLRELPEMKKIWTFLARDEGAVTVDWVVLTAAIIGLCVLIASAMQDGAMGLADALMAYMANWTFG